MRRDRFGALDALRGLAAIAVVLFHVEEVNLSGPLLPHAYFAVDFFFALSGFVIAYTYEAKLRNGLTFGTFVARRLIRLYPMIVFGVCFGSLVLAIKLLTDPARVDPVDHAVVSMITNLFLVPTPFVTPASRGLLYMTDGPLWSVALEILVNIVWCLALVRASNRILATIVGLCLVYLVLNALRIGSTDMGFNWMTAAGGLARVGFGFGVGLLVYRLRARLVVARSFTLKLAVMALLLGVFAVPRLHQLELPFDLLVVPLTLILGLNGADNPRADRILGEASYPLYAIHFPVLLLVSGIHQKVPYLPLGILYLAAAVALALATFLVTRLYDEPMRRALSVWWSKREGRLSSATVAVAQ